MYTLVAQNNSIRVAKPFDPSFDLRCTTIRIALLNHSNRRFAKPFESRCKTIRIALQNHSNRALQNHSIHVAKPFESYVAKPFESRCKTIRIARRCQTIRITFRIARCKTIQIALQNHSNRASQNQSIHVAKPFEACVAKPFESRLNPEYRSGHGCPYAPIFPYYLPLALHLGIMPAGAYHSCAPHFNPPLVNMLGGV